LVQQYAARPLVKTSPVLAHTMLSMTRFTFAISSGLSEPPQDQPIKLVGQVTFESVEQPPAASVVPPQPPATTGTRSAANGIKYQGILCIMSRSQ
jgi:hypothetical protein